MTDTDFERVVKELRRNDVGFSNLYLTSRGLYQKRDGKYWPIYLSANYE